MPQDTETGGTAPSRRFFARPCSTLGQVSVLLFGLSLMLALMNSTVIESLTRSQPGRPLLGVVFAGLTFLCALASGIVGFVALAFQRERSAVVFLTTTVSLIIVGGEMLQMLTGL